MEISKKGENLFYVSVFMIQSDMQLDWEQKTLHMSMDDPGYFKLFLMNMNIPCTFR